jgi:hypothetical protein
MVHACMSKSPPIRGDVLSSSKCWGRLLLRRKANSVCALCDAIMMYSVNFKVKFNLHHCCCCLLLLTAAICSVTAVTVFLLPAQPTAQ